MSGLVSGVIHVHSDFSKDGLCSVAELADFARDSGFGFVALTDHAEDLSGDDVKALGRECEKSSDPSFVMIPGLEFRCSGGIHILGLGIRDHIWRRDPLEVASQIRVRGGLAILAHPGGSEDRCPRALGELLDGIEIWNAAYDGRVAPPVANIRLLENMRHFNPAIAGFGGADLHGLHLPPGVILQMQVNESARGDARMLLEHLRLGRFVIRGRFITLDAHASYSWLTRACLWMFRKSYEVSKTIRDVALGES